MIKNAVLNLELLTRMRSWRAPAIITAYLVLLGGIFFMVYDLTYINGAPQPSEIGAQMYYFLASLQFALLSFSVPALTAGVISGERERQTLDFLLTTNLSPLKIVLGKLGAALSFILLLLISSLPLFSLIFLMGGVAPFDIIKLFGVYILTAIYFGSLGVFFSALIKRSQMATVLTYLTMLIQYSLTYFVPAFYREVFGKTGGYLDLPLAFFLNPLTVFLEILMPQREADNLLKGMAHIQQNVVNWQLRPEWITALVLIFLCGFFIWLAGKRLLSNFN